MGPVEFCVKLIPDENRLEELHKLQQEEGWQLLPGTLPVPIPGVTPALTAHAMFRAAVVPQQQPTTQGTGGITIDESKVHIIRAKG